MAVHNPKSQDQGATTKSYFTYHGGGVDPNIDSWRNRTTKIATDPALSFDGGVAGDWAPYNNHIGTGDASSHLLVQNFKLTLNGQDRHPSLAAEGLDRDYLMNRMMPMMHSNVGTNFTDSAMSRLWDGSESDMMALGEKLDRKEIYVYPFSLNPEGANPSGAVNFSKVSHAKLTITGIATQTLNNHEDYQVDVYGVHYNWLQIKDGRALTSFA